MMMEGKDEGKGMEYISIIELETYYIFNYCNIFNIYK